MANPGFPLIVHPNPRPVAKHFIGRPGVPGLPRLPVYFLDPWESFFIIDKAGWGKYTIHVTDK